MKELIEKQKELIEHYKTKPDYGDRFDKYNNWVVKRIKLETELSQLEQSDAYYNRDKLCERNPDKADREKGYCKCTSQRNLTYTKSKDNPHCSHCHKDIDSRPPQ